MKQGAKLITEFESRQLPKTEWTHRAHLEVALHYLDRHSPSETLRILREGIQHLNLAHGVYTTRSSGYHETRTRVWLAVLAAGLSRELSKNALLTQYEFTDVVNEHYTREWVESFEARVGWVEPDIRPLPIDPGAWCTQTPELFSLR